MKERHWEEGEIKRLEERSRTCVHFGREDFQYKKDAKGRRREEDLHQASFLFSFIKESPTRQLWQKRGAKILNS